MDSSSEDDNHSYLFGKGPETKSISSEDSSSSDRKKSKSSSEDEEYDAVARKKSRNELQMGKYKYIKKVVYISSVKLFLQSLLTLSCLNFN